MESENPILEEYRKRLPDEIAKLRQLIEALKKEYSLSHLEHLRRELDKFARSAEEFGYLLASQLCKELETSLIGKIKNYSLELYPGRLETWNLGCAKAPRLNDRKSVHISNIDRLAIVQPRELSRQSKSKFQTDRGIKSDWTKTLDGFINQLEKALLKRGSMAKSEPKISSKKNTVLIIDDDEDLLHLLTYEFHQLGFEVKSFTRGEDALNFLMKEENCRDLFLIILDRILPDMDGLDILRTWNKKSPNKIPVLITSILSTEKDIVTGLQNGAIDYIVKPFSIYMLMQKALNLVKTEK